MYCTYIRYIVKDKQGPLCEIDRQLLTLPFLLGFLLLYVLPFGQPVYYSVIASAFDHTFVGLANYEAAWSNACYRLALASTLQFTSASAANSGERA